MLARRQAVGGGSSGKGEGRVRQATTTAGHRRPRKDIPAVISGEREREQFLAQAAKYAPVVSHVPVVRQRAAPPDSKQPLRRRPKGTRRGRTTIAAHEPRAYDTFKRSPRSQHWSTSGELAPRKSVSARVAQPSRGPHDRQQLAALVDDWDDWQRSLERVRDSSDALTYSSTAGTALPHIGTTPRYPPRALHRPDLVSTSPVHTAKAAALSGVQSQSTLAKATQLPGAAARPRRPIHHARIETASNDPVNVLRKVLQHHDSTASDDAARLPAARRAPSKATSFTAAWQREGLPRPPPASPHRMTPRTHALGTRSHPQPSPLPKSRSRLLGAAHGTDGATLAEPRPVRVFDWTHEASAVHFPTTSWVAHAPPMSDGTQGPDLVGRAEQVLAAGLREATALGWATKAPAKAAAAAAATYSHPQHTHGFALPTVAAPTVLVASAVEALAVLAQALVSPASDIIATAVSTLDGALTLQGHGMLAPNQAPAMWPSAVAPSHLRMRTVLPGNSPAPLFAVHNVELERTCNELRARLASWGALNDKLRKTFGNLSAAKGTTEESHREVNSETSASREKVQELEDTVSDLKRRIIGQVDAKNRLPIELARQHARIKAAETQLALLEASFIQPLHTKLREAEEVLNDYHDTDRRLREMTARAHKSGTIPELQARVHRYQEHLYALCQRYDRDLPRLGRQEGAVGEAYDEKDRIEKALQAFTRTHTPRPAWEDVLADLPEVQATTTAPCQDSDVEDAGAVEAVERAERLHKQRHAEAVKTHAKRGPKRATSVFAPPPPPRPPSRVAARDAAPRSKNGVDAGFKPVPQPAHDSSPTRSTAARRKLLRSAPTSRSRQQLVVPPHMLPQDGHDTTEQSAVETVPQPTELPTYDARPGASHADTARRRQTPVRATSRRRSRAGGSEARRTPASRERRRRNHNRERSPPRKQGSRQGGRRGKGAKGGSRNSRRGLSPGGRTGRRGDSRASGASTKPRNVDSRQGRPSSALSWFDDDADSYFSWTSSEASLLSDDSYRHVMSVDRAWSPMSDPTGKGDEPANARRIRPTIDICEDMAEAVDNMRVREAMEHEYHATQREARRCYELLKSTKAKIEEVWAQLPEALRGDANKKKKKASKPAPKHKKQASERFFIGLGVGPHVPKFLKFKGKIRNREMKKGEVEALVKQVWAEKAAYEASSHTHVLLTDFFYTFLKNKCGIQTLVAEMGYNIIHALEKYVADADLELFMLCLAGAVPDEAYTDQVAMLASFKKLMEKLESAYGERRYVEHTTASGKRQLLPVGPGTNLVRKRDLVATLKQFFPEKASADMKDMVDALGEDPAMRKGDRVAYKHLFDENEDGDQNDFAEAVRDQHLEEIQTCAARLTNAMMSKDHNKSGWLRVLDIRHALQQMDPSISRSRTNQYLRQGTQHSVKELKWDTKVDYEQFMQNLKNTLLRKERSWDAGAMPVVSTGGWPESLSPSDDDEADDAAAQETDTDGPDAVDAQPSDTDGAASTKPKAVASASSPQHARVPGRVRRVGSRRRKPRKSRGTKPRKSRLRT